MAHPFDPRGFRVHDVADFPIVRMRVRVVRPGYGADWVREMEQLLAGPRQFVLLYTEAQAEEAHEDFKLRGIWMKVNKERLAARCKAVIRVEPNAGERARMLKHLDAVQKAFGVPNELAVTAEEALTRARFLSATLA